MPAEAAKFPHAPIVDVGEHSFDSQHVIRVLEDYVSDERKSRIKQVVANRTYNVVPVLEGLSDAGNLHAVLRSAEGLGFGATFLVAPQREALPLVDRYLVGEESEVLGKRAKARAAQGAQKWLDLSMWRQPDEFVRSAKARGYKILATHLASEAMPIDQWDFTQPTALVFGNEKAGVSDLLLAHADANVVLPIDGFIQSYNVSVAAALSLYQARQDRIARQGYHGDLNEKEQGVLTAHFYLRSVAAAEKILLRELGAS